MKIPVLKQKRVQFRFFDSISPLQEDEKQTLIACMNRSILGKQINTEIISHQNYYNLIQEEFLTFFWSESNIMKLLNISEISPLSFDDVFMKYLNKKDSEKKRPTKS
jgi:hypothetical protein